jgi:hypothetical protein
MRRSTYKDILKFLQDVLPGCKNGQKSRRLCLMTSLICACIENGHCRLESLSEATDAYRSEKKSSLLQQVKRWLSNKWVNIETFYLPFAQYFLQGIAHKGEIIFIVDGTQTGKATTTLMLSALCRGFAIPVAWVVKKGEKGHFEESLHLDLLRLVAPICPQQCRIVLLGDGEFDGQLLRGWCIEQGWEFVVRTACDCLIDFDGEIARFDSIQTLESIVFISNAVKGANAVYWHEKKHDKPLYLLTNMDLAYQATQYYKHRFKIETLFKHFKSAGFYIHKTRLKCPIKVAKLIIVVALAFIFTYCMGAFIKENEQKRILESIVRKDRLMNISNIAIAQISIKKNINSILLFFSELSKNFHKVVT